MEQRDYKKEDSCQCKMQIKLIEANNTDCDFITGKKKKTACQLPCRATADRLESEITVINTVQYHQKR